MMLPIIARASDVVLRVVPGGLREASLALGASRWRTVWHVVLPTARPGLATACILGIARGIGETSPVLLTSGNAQFLVVNPTDGVMNSLPLFVYSLVRTGEPNAVARAFAAATVLLAVVMVLFVTARLIARPKRHQAAAGRRSPPSRRGPRHGRPARRDGPGPAPPARTRGEPVNRPVRVVTRAARGHRPGDEPPGRRVDLGPRHRLRPDRGHRLHLVRADRPAVDRRRRRQRHEGRLHRRRLDQGPQGLLAGQHRLRDLRDPLPGHRRARPGRHQQRARVRLPADRRRRHGVHLPAQDRQRAGPQPAALGRDAREDLHQPDHQLERPGDRQGQQRPQVPVAADHPGRPLGRLRHDGAVHDLDGQRSTRTSGGPTSASPGSRRTTRRRATGWSARRGPTR